MGELTDKPCGSESRSSVASIRLESDPQSVLVRDVDGRRAVSAVSTNKASGLIRTFSNLEQNGKYQNPKQNHIDSRDEQYDLVVIILSRLTFIFIFNVIIIFLI